MANKSLRKKKKFVIRYFWMPCHVLDRKRRKIEVCDDVYVVFLCKTFCNTTQHKTYSEIIFSVIFYRHFHDARIFYDSNGIVKLFILNISSKFFRNISTFACWLIVNCTRMMTYVDKAFTIC